MDRTIAALAVVLIVVGAWAYSTSFHGVFVGDDIDAIVNNPHVTALPDVRRAMDAPKDTTVAGRPVVSLSLAVNHAVAPAPPLDPWGFHAVNLGVHLCAGLALFGVVRRSLIAAPLREGFGQASTSLAFAVALLWLVHPLQTASVTYIVQRAESLMGLFFLLTLYCAMRATEPGARGRGWTAGAVLACALGMGSKEVMVVAPLVVALWTWVLRPEQRFVNATTRPLFIGLAATWLLLAWLVASDARGESVGFGLGDWTWWSYLRTQAAVIARYLRLAVFPDLLIFSYAWPPASSWMEVAPEIVLLALLGSATVVAVARRHPAGLPGAWFFLILAPSSSVLPIATEVAAEHRMYLPVAAVIAVIVLGVYAAARRLGPPGAATRVAGWLLIAAAAGALASVTHARNRDYWSLEALMLDTIEKRPENVKARVTYGGELVSQQRFEEAEPHLRAAIELPQPSTNRGLTALAHMYLGSSLAAQNKLAEGIAHLERALTLGPWLGEAHALLGAAYASQGRLAEAAQSFERALRALPDIPPLLDRVARLLATAPDPAARNGVHAERYAQRALQLRGAPDWRLLDTLAAAYAEQGRFRDAIAAIERARAAAMQAGDPAAAAVLDQRLALYRAGQPLRER